MRCACVWFEMLDQQSHCNSAQKHLANVIHFHICSDYRHTYIKIHMYSIEHNALEGDCVDPMDNNIPETDSWFPYTELLNQHQYKDIDE